MFLHLGQFAKFVIRELDRQIEAIDEQGEPVGIDAGPAVGAGRRSAALRALSGAT